MKGELNYYTVGGILNYCNDAGKNSSAIIHRALPPPISSMVSIGECTIKPNLESFSRCSISNEW